MIVAAGCVVYANSFSGAFVFDDESVILANPHIKLLWPPSEALAAPPDSPVRDRPVVSLSFSINYALFGESAVGYHAFNLVIHCISALLLFGILNRTFSSHLLSGRYGPSAIGLALAAAILWEVHPLQTESVTYITQRCESLMGLFYLGTLYSLIRGASSRRPTGWYVSSVLLCALGMGSKAVMVTAPPMVLIYDRIFIARGWREVWQKRWWYYLALFATLIILAILVATTSYRDIKTHRPLEYALSQFGIISHYLRLSFWPSPLVLDYRWVPASGIGEILPGGLLVAALLVLTIRGLARAPALGFAGVWFFLILAPTSSLLPLEDLAFEHRMYLPLAAVLVLGVVCGYELLVRIPGLSASSRRGWGITLTVVTAVALGGLTIERNQDYRSAEVIWRDVAEKRPLNPRARNMLGNIALRENDPALAFRLYRAAIGLDPDYQAANYNLANLLAGRGDLAAAVGYYEKTLEINPEAVEAHNNLGVALYQLGKREEAFTHYRAAIRIDPADPAAYYNTGLTLLKDGRPDEAIPYLERAVSLRPEYPAPRQALKAARTEAGIEK